MKSLSLPRPSPFGMDLLIDVTGPVPGTTMVALSGTYYAKVFDGPFRRAWLRPTTR